jgi:serine/threonine protein kinase
MVQGRPPNNDINTIEKLPQLAERDPPTFKEPRKFSPAFNDFLKRCLVKDPAQRPSAIDLLTDPFMMAMPSADVLKDIIYECLSLRKKKPVDPQTLQVLS